MEQKLSMDEIEKRFSEINAREPEKPMVEDLDAFAEADVEDPADAVTLDDYRTATDPFKANQARIRDAIARLDSGLGVEHELIETEAVLYELFKEGREFSSVSAEQMEEDAKRILEESESDYDRMAK